MVSWKVRAELAGDQRDDARMESAVSLSLEPSVTSVGWQVDNGEEEPA